MHNSRDQLKKHRNHYNDRFIRLPEVMAKTGLSRSTIYRKMENKEFPLTLSLGARSVAWLESEVINWMLINIIERNDKT
ncbi:AlpA family transcriptional regulator [Vibrio renipiscarius]